MADTKLGWNQLNIPAPLWYRRFSNAMIVGVIPSTAALIAGWGLAEKTVMHANLLLIFCAGLIKALGMFLGNGQTYAPSNDAIDNAKSNEK